MTSAPALSPVCGATAVLPVSLSAQVVALAAPHGSAELPDVEVQLRCCLQDHECGAHYALALDLPGAETGAVWARWEAGAASPCFVLEVLPDCPATDRVSREPCSEFAGHHGGHTYELTDDVAPDSRGTPGVGSL
ncbi:hypothetical protein [Streptomyces sp. NPDC049040]|uniref:hypothetical protein n=1 Tax=Streptomyces sp. NPDC049040 TaxID=3365593 RepID=UPI00371AB3CC